MRQRRRCFIGRLDPRIAVNSVQLTGTLEREPAPSASTALPVNMGRQLCAQSATARCPEYINSHGRTRVRTGIMARKRCHDGSMMILCIVG